MRGQIKNINGTFEQNKKKNKLVPEMLYAFITTIAPCVKCPSSEGKRKAFRAVVVSHTQNGYGEKLNVRPKQDLTRSHGGEVAQNALLSFFFYGKHICTFQNN